jgi:hypothetical protein
MTTWFTQNQPEEGVAPPDNRETVDDVAGLSELDRDLYGYLLQPGDFGFDAAARQDNPVFRRKPLAVAYCEQEKDIPVCIRWARKRGVSVTFRSGGHSTAGYSVLDGALVVDVSHLTHIEVDPDARRARVQPGVNFGKLNTVLDHYRLHVPGGGCETVCVAGFMQGGGYGFTSRSFGMNCDMVEEVGLYDRDGNHVVARPDATDATARDLFWAIRGGTGGNFGAVSHIVYRLVPLGEVWGFGLRWSLSRKDSDAVGRAVRALEIMEYDFMGPDHESLGYMAFMIATKEGPALYMRGICTEGKHAGLSLLKPLCRETDIGKPELDMPGRYARLNAALLRDLEPSGLGTLREVKVSNYIARPLGAGGWARVVKLYVNRPDMKAAAANTVALEPYGGRISAPRHESAFIHRAVATDLVIDSFYSDDDEKPEAEAWLEDYRELLRGPDGISNGRVYQNYPEAGLNDWQERYFGSAFDRLLEIKTRVDPPDPVYPHGFFHFPQSIRPREAEPAHSADASTSADPA